MNELQNGRSCSTSCKGTKCEKICKICANGKCQISKDQGKGETSSLQDAGNNPYQNKPSGQNTAFK